MSNHRKINVLLPLLTAAVLSAGALITPPAQACGGYTQPSEQTQARWAVVNHFKEQHKVIKRVAVNLTGENSAAAVLHFKKDTKLPPLNLRLVKVKGVWKVAATKTWRA